MKTGDVDALEGHAEQVTAVALGADDTRIASSGRDDTARLWDIATRQLLHTLTGHTDDVMSVEFSHDGQNLLTAACDGSVRIWNVQTGEQLHMFEDQAGKVYTAIWLPGDEIIATGGEDGFLRLRNVENGEIVVEMDLKSHVADLAVAPDGNHWPPRRPTDSFNLLKRTARHLNLDASFRSQTIGLPSNRLETRLHPLEVSLLELGNGASGAVSRRLGLGDFDRLQKPLALLSVSRYSVVGMLSATMPAPAWT